MDANNWHACEETLSAANLHQVQFLHINTAREDIKGKCNRLE